MIVGVKICETKDTIKKYEDLEYKFVSEENIGEGYLKPIFKDPVVPEENADWNSEVFNGRFNRKYIKK
jgi:hypothetical protein